MNMENISRAVYLPDGKVGKVDLNEPVLRYSRNPILTAADVNRVWTRPEWQVVTVHNAGVARYAGLTYLLFRSHLRCGISVIGLASSRNGLTNWRIHPEPVLKPATETDHFATEDRELISQWIENEGGGVEDPRINPIEGEFAITYSAYHQREKNRVRVSLATTADFLHYTRRGPVAGVDMRNVVIFPEKIEGRYVGLFRPNDTTAGDIGGIYSQIRIGYSDDWRGGKWEISDRPIMQTGFGPSAFSDKIGPGAPPLKTRFGWLNIFHGVRTTMDGNPYVLGVAFHDLKNPEKVQMASLPILFPSRADCRLAENQYIHVPQVVFTCGAVLLEEETVAIYYGGNDTVMNVAFSNVEVLYRLCRDLGQDPLTGELRYSI
ncbi:MAG: glycosidase [Calditrichia bacterium]